jgi:hypothetical protein
MQIDGGFSANASPIWANRGANSMVAALSMINALRPSEADTFRH